MHKTEVLVYYKVARLKPIKFCKTSWMSYLKIMRQIWLWQKCVPDPHNIMG